MRPAPSAAQRSRRDTLAGSCPAPGSRCRPGPAGSCPRRCLMMCCQTNSRRSDRAALTAAMRKKSQGLYAIFCYRQGIHRSRARSRSNLPNLPKKILHKIYEFRWSPIFLLLFYQPEINVIWRVCIGIAPEFLGVIFIPLFKK